MKKLTLNQQVTVKGKTYKVIGIDHYKLKNILDKNKTWISYTLIDSEKNKTWISHGVAGKYFTQWAVLTEKEFKKHAHAKLDLDLTGIATVTFEGNPGYSTPTAEMVWFRPTDTPYTFLLLERFLKQNNDKAVPLEPYYQTGTVLKETNDVTF